MSYPYLSSTKRSSMTKDSASSFEPPYKCFIDELPNELLLDIFFCGTRCTSGTAFSFRVSTICQRWRYLAINSPNLWTSLAMDTTIMPRPVVQSPPSNLSTTFPREFLILERSSNMDVDIMFAHDRSPKFTPEYFESLSTFFSAHARHIRTLDVHVDDAVSASILCSRLHGVVLPRLQKFRLNWDRPYQRLWDPEDRYGLFSSTHMLDYSHADNIPTPVDLQQWSTSKYPMLTDVTCAGIPMKWELFSASNLRTLCLRNDIRREPPIAILRGILFNSMNTLESLELGDIINFTDPSELHPVKARLVLPHVHTLILGNYDPDEIRFAVRAFAFPALRNLAINAPLGDPEKDIFVTLIRYIPLDQLQKLKFRVTCFHNFVLPHPHLVREGNIMEESLPPPLQFIRRLTSLHTLELQCSCESWEPECPGCDIPLRLMNYPTTNSTDQRSGTLNLPRLQSLSIRADNRMGPQVLKFLRNRIKLGSVNGEYVGPVLETLKLFLWTARPWEEEYRGLLEDRSYLLSLTKELCIKFDM
ncbi:hypothetical protein IW261DRAFT_1507188 [Armillaria novae-zelandiae]|uniref:F-box domain-containing protein n=1 Tax=Armillaria novae-zelandiae TaxID=153914 RepID=A0AA39NVG8_9AGAR|nr:hypothetical protein IW261DRAFT_1507188 [Armillaria novae-zelandiae]